MSIFGEIVRRVREGLHLDPDPDSLPRIDRMAFYRAKVETCASDGSTVDIRPLDPRFKSMQGIKLKVGAPGEVVVMAAGALVMFGWEDGDDSKPYCTPAWDAGATVTKRLLNGTLVILGAEAGAQFLALSNLVDLEFGRVKATLDSLSGASFAVPYAAPASTAAQNSKGK